MDADFRHDAGRAATSLSTSGACCPCCRETRARARAARRQPGQVRVPLCGKSLDMHRLAEQGQRVLGVELSPLAVGPSSTKPACGRQRHASRPGKHWTAGASPIICGDTFALKAGDLAGIAGVCARGTMSRDDVAGRCHGAMVALPAPMRRRCVDSVYAALPEGCRSLLPAPEYPQHEMAGPPFDIDETEMLRELAGWQPTLLARRKLAGQQAGATASAACRRCIPLPIACGHGADRP